MSLDRPMMAQRQVRLAAKAAVDVIPAVTVLTPGDWNIPLTNLPAIKVRAVGDVKTAIQRGMFEAITLVQLEIEAAVASVSESAAQDAIEALGYAIERAIFLNGPLVAISQKFSSSTCTTEVRADGLKHIGGLRMQIGVEIFEAFDPTADEPADAVWPPVWATPVPLDEVSIKADLTNVFDPDGTYAAPTEPAYTPTPAPRTSGPDGRDEAGLDITLPQ